MDIAVSNLIDPVLALLFPNRCYYCKKVLEKGCFVCSDCLKAIDIIQAPFCKKCGAPLGKEIVIDRHCFQCRNLVFHFQRNESLGVFSGKLRDYIHVYKFEKRRFLYRIFTDLLVQYKKEYIMSHDVLVPMPLTQSRYTERGFNQSYLIAKEISKRVPILFSGHGVIRRGKSRPQSSIPTIKERLNNVTDRFLLKKGSRKLIKDKNILIFDDVLTTGATSSKCAQALYEEEAQNVDILTIARAIKDKNQP